MNVDQLKAFNPGGFTAAASALEAASTGANSSQSSLNAAGGTMGGWSGPAASAVTGTLSDMRAALSPAPALLEGAHQVLASFVTAVTVAQDKLNTALAKAQSLGCQVGPDGTVTAPAQPPGQPPQVCFADPTQEAARVKAQNAYDNNPAVKNWKDATQQAPTLQSAIQAALQDASQADSRASGDLAQASAGAKAFTQVAGGNLGAPLTDLNNDKVSLQTDAGKWSQSLAARARAAKAHHGGGGVFGWVEGHVIDPVAHAVESAPQAAGDAWNWTEHAAGNMGSWIDANAGSLAKSAGDVAGIAGSAALAAGGGIAEGGGAALDATGAGAIFGIPLNAAGAAAMATGAAGAGYFGHNLSKDANFHEARAQGQNSGDGPTKTDRLKEHLTDRDLEAAQRELDGETVATKPNGTPWNHVQEVQEAQHGLVNRINQIKRQLGDSRISDADRAGLNAELSEASRLLDHSEQYVPRN